MKDINAKMSASAKSAALRLASMVNAANDGETVVMPAGWIDCAVLGEKGLQIYAKNHLTLQANTKRTVLYNSLVESNVVTFQNTRFTTIEKTNIVASRGGIGVKMEWDGVNNYNTIGNIITRCHIQNGLYGVKIGDGYHHSTSENKVTFCEISSQDGAGICLDTGNGQNTAILDSYITGTPIGIYCKRGAIFADRVVTVSHSDCAYYFSDVSQTPCTIANGYMEASPCFLKTDGPTTQRCTINLFNCMMYPEGRNGNMHTSCIVMKNTGPLNIYGGEMRAAANSTTEITVAAGAYCPVNVYGLSIYDTDMQQFATINATGGFDIRNCLKSYTNGNTPVPFSRPLLASEDGITTMHVVSTTDAQSPPRFDTQFLFNSGLIDYNHRGAFVFNYNRPYKADNSGPDWFQGSNGNS